MDFEEFRSVAEGGPELPASGASDDEGDPDDGGDSRPDPDPVRPTMSLDMGPEGTSVALDAPLNDMDAQEAINLAQEVQGPSMGEEVKEVLLDPTVQDILRDVWYGPDDDSRANEARARTRETKSMDPTDQLEPEPEEPTATDGGEELRDENIYEITPEALVAILQQQIAEVSALRPDMTMEGLATFMEKNEERLVGEAADLLEAMDGDE